MFWAGFDDVTVGGSNLCDLAYNALGLKTDPYVNSDGQAPGYHLVRPTQLCQMWPLTERAERLDISDYDGDVWFSINGARGVRGIWKDPNVQIEPGTEFEVT